MTFPPHFRRAQHQVEHSRSIASPAGGLEDARRTAASLFNELEIEPVGVPHGLDGFFTDAFRFLEFANTQPDSLGTTLASLSRAF